MLRGYEYDVAGETSVAGKLLMSKTYEEFMINMDLMGIEKFSPRDFTILMSGLEYHEYLERALCEVIKNTSIFDNLIFEPTFNIEFYEKKSDYSSSVNPDDFVHFEFIERLINGYYTTLNKSIFHQYQIDKNMQLRIAKVVLDKMGKSLDINKILSLKNIKWKLGKAMI